jgi:hypothetical protein
MSERPDERAAQNPGQGAEQPVSSGRQADGRFAPGNSLGAAGRPLGTRHKATLALEALLDGEAEGLTRKAVEMALGGDTTALRLCLERIAPPVKSRRVAFDLPKIEKAEDLLAAFSAVVTSMAAGELGADEAALIASVLEAKRKTIETVDIEKRLAAIEAKDAQK